MQPTTFRKSVTSELVTFAWERWSQLGVFAPGQRNDRWAVDPEALLIFTLEIGRRDPRLLDEVLDWLLKNERLMSVQRLRNLATDTEDKQLLEAAIRWVARWHPKEQIHAPPAGSPSRVSRPALSCRLP